MLEIIHEYITCEIGGSGDTQPKATDANKNLAVALDGNQADSIHPKVKYISAATESVFGKFVSVTPNGNQIRVAVRGDNMIFAGDATPGTTAGDTAVADADVGKGLVWDTNEGKVGPGAALGSRDADERGHIIGGTAAEIRVSFP